MNLSVYFAQMAPNASRCSGDSMPLHAGGCLKLASTSWLKFECRNETLIQRLWRKRPATPPAVPRDVRCEASAAGVESVLAHCEADASLADQVSFEVALADDSRSWPFLHFTAPVRADGTVRAVVPGLRPGTPYRIAARAHLRGHSEGDPSAWSNASRHRALCATLPAGDWHGRSSGEGTASASATAGERPRTRWIEVYRENSYSELPDFLDDHNSADFAGEFAMYGPMAVIGQHPITRYCVELLDVTLTGIMTTTTTGRPVSSPYADYLSCMGGDCLCQNLVDRMLARQPAEQIQPACPGLAETSLCTCNESGLAVSRKYTGMTVVPLPFGFNFNQANGSVLPDGYPPPFHLPASGQWYSHPVSSRCPPGAQVGDGGCTWRRAPLSHSVYTVDLADMGLNVTIKQSGHSMWVDESVSQQDLDVGRRAFGAMELPPCGSPEAGTYRGTEVLHDELADAIIV